jgi:Uma2 family endonuclease
MASSSSTEVRRDDMGSVYWKRRAHAAVQKEGEMTTAEYLATEETLLPRELAYGVLRVADSPGGPHQRIVGRLHLAIAPVAAAAGGEVVLSPMDVVLDYDRALVVQPDLLYISRERAGIFRYKVNGAPDLVVEVLSPHPRIGKLNERVAWFAKYGVRECWLADLPSRQYSVLLLNERGVASRRLCRPGQVAESDVLPGVVLPSLDA